MKKRIIFTTIFVLMGLYCPGYAQDKVTEDERVKLDYMMLKIKDISGQINGLAETRDGLVKDYSKYYSDLMTKYNKVAEKTNIDLKDGKFLDVIAKDKNAK